MTVKNLSLLLMVLGVFASCAGGNKKTNNNTVNNVNNCSSACTVGYQQCAENVLQTCVTGTPCPAWSNTENCSDSSSTCTAVDADHTASCVAGCAGACTPGYQQCVSNVVQTCADDTPCPTWGNTENCSDSSKTCSAVEANHTASCTVNCTDECATGESTCVNNEVHSCSASGDCLAFSLSQNCVLTGQICEFNQLAQQASCVDSCTPSCTIDGEDQCDGNVIKTCSLVSGCLQWVTGTDCSLTSQSCQLIGQNASCQTVGSLNLFFSEYVEGSGNNKGLEIYVMSAPGGFNLSSCAVEIYSNGSASASASIALSSASLTGGSRFELCHSQWALAFTCDQLAGNLTFNGDDAVRLVCSGVTMDVIGQIGFDPGLSWTGGAVSTVDSTLRRNCGTIAGDTNGADTFDPSVEWTSAGIDDVSNMGTFLPCK